MKAIKYLLAFFIPVFILIILIQSGIIILDQSSIKQITNKISFIIPGIFPEGKVISSGKIYSEKLVSNSSSIKLHLRNLLQEGNYSQINLELEQYQKSADENIDTETDLYTAYDAFQLNDLSIEMNFSKWIESDPEAYQPYLARGSYYSFLGWNARGTAWASETKKEQFARMDDFFDRAVTDLNTAIRLHKQCMVAYSRLIGINNARGKDLAEREVMKKALSINPLSYKIREHFLNGIVPRWGGSFDEMISFAKESQEYVAKNKNLNLLLGKPYIESGDLESLNSVYSKAIDYYTQALTYGDNPEAYFRRGKAYVRSENLQKALDDFNQAISLYQENGDYYHWRARTYVSLGQLDKAKDDIIFADQLKPGDDNILKYIKWISYAYSKEAREDIENNQYDSAIEKTKAAIELDEDHIDHLLLLDWLLAKHQDWDQIIAYWDNFIERNPDNSRAYVERGGAYYHKGDMRSAVENAKIAADMGNAEGKEAYEKFNHFVR